MVWFYEFWFTYLSMLRKKIVWLNDAMNKIEITNNLHDSDSHFKLINLISTVDSWQLVKCLMNLMRWLFISQMKESKILPVGLNSLGSPYMVVKTNAWFVPYNQNGERISKLYKKMKKWVTFHRMWNVHKAHFVKSVNKVITKIKYVNLLDIFSLV